MVCALMDHRNDVEMFKTQVEPWATGEWFHRKVLNILTSFESMVHVKSMENCFRFVFYNNIDRLYCRFPLKSPRNSCVLQWQKQIVSPSAHFLCLYTHWTWLLTNQWTRIRSVIATQHWMRRNMIWRLGEFSLPDLHNSSDHIIYKFSQG